MYVINNTTYSEAGAAIYTFAQASIGPVKLVVSQSTFTGNSGIAIANVHSGVTILSQSTISGNTAINGAGIYSSTAVTIENSIVAGNSSTKNTDIVLFRAFGNNERLAR